MNLLLSWEAYDYKRRTGLYPVLSKFSSGGGSIQIDYSSKISHTTSTPT